MSEENVVDFPTTANKEEASIEIDTSPEGLKKLAEQGTPQVLQLVNQNRKEGAEQLRRKFESLETELEECRNWVRKNEAPLLVLGDEDKTVFSLENALINIQKSLEACSTVVDAQNSLMDMIINDIMGMVQNLNAVQHAVMVSNGQCQTLIELLMKKEFITDQEMRETWETLVQGKKEQMKATEPEQQQPLPGEFEEPTRDE